jgi:GNAT superfamily N-acetyltransferase
MESIEFRQYRPFDHAQVLQLHFKGLEQTGVRLNDDFHSGYDADLTRIEAEYLQNGEFLIATINEELIGMGAIRKIDNRTAEIRRMRVEPDYQGQGLGSLILDRLMETAKALGYTRLILDTTDKMSVARRLYENRGFKEYRRNILDGFTVIFYEMNLDMKK